MTDFQSVLLIKVKSNTTTGDVCSSNDVILSDRPVQISTMRGVPESMMRYQVVINVVVNVASCKSKKSDIII